MSGTRRAISAVIRPSPQPTSSTLRLVELQSFERMASKPLLQVADSAILRPVPVRHGYILLRVLEPIRA